MATHLPPPPLIFSPQHSDNGDYLPYAVADVCQRPLEAYCYSHPRLPSTSSSTGARDASALVVSNQVSKGRVCYQSCISISIVYV